jgi:hypothetical protein
MILRKRIGTFRLKNPNWNFDPVATRNPAVLEQLADTRFPESRVRAVLAKSLIGALAVAISMFFAWSNLDQGWFPHDEGQLGQAAERVLRGELPHRDFDDMYTGGLSMLNALSFQLWGINSHSMRLMLFIWFVPFVVAIYWLASQLTRPWAAGLITLLAAAWSIPIYSAPMPSWYNLFFATWTLCAVVAYFNTKQRRYVFLAGLLIGLSVTFKISGVFILAAVLLALLFRNQQSFRDEPETGWVFSVVVSLGLIVASLISLSFVNQRDWLAQTVHLALPFAGLTGFLIFNEWNSARGRGVARFWAISTEVLILASGLMIPVLGLASYYLQQGAFEALVQGVLVMPKQRFEFATFPFPSITNLIFVLPLAMLLFPSIARIQIGRQQERGVFVCAMVIAAALLAAQKTPAGFTLAFQSFRNLAPVLVLGNLILIFQLRDRLSPDQQQRLFLFTAIAFFASLIQFPFAVPVYFFFAAPLLLLAALSTVCLQNNMPQKTLTVVVVFLLLFSCTRLQSHNAVLCLFARYPDLPAAKLHTERSQLRVNVDDAQVYNRLNELILQQTTSTETILATPDAPIVSFLSERQPLNGVMYEFFRDGIYDDLNALRKQLDEKHVKVVVINERPAFSPGVTDDFRHLALAEFELLESIGVETDEPAAPRFSVYKRRPAVIP